MKEPSSGKESSLLHLANETVLYGVADFLPRLINFALLPLMTRFLKPGDYGLLALVQVVTSIAEILYLVGAETAFSRIYPEAKNPEQMRRMVKTFSVQVLLQGLVASTILAVFLPSALNFVLGAGALPFWPYGLSAIVLPLLSLAAAVPLLQARIDGRPRFYLAFRLASFVISISGILYFVVGRNQGAWGSIKGQLLAAFVSALVLLWIYRDTYLRSSVDWASLKRSFRFGFPIFTGQASQWLFSFSDRVFIQRFRTIETVGLFQIASNFVLPVDFLINSINFAWAPKFFRETIGLQNHEKLTREAMRIFGAVLFALVAYLSLIRPIITFMTASEFHIAFRISDLLVLYFATRIFYCLTVNALAAFDKTGSIARITVISGVAQLGANALLIPPFGALGAAVAQVLAGVVRAIATAWVFVKVWPVRVSPRTLLYLSLLFGTSCGVILVADYASVSAWHPASIATKLAAVLFFYVAARRLDLMFPLGRLLSLNPLYLLRKKGKE